MRKDCSFIKFAVANTSLRIHTMTMQMVVLTAYAYLYGRLYLSLIGLEQSIC